MELNRLILRLRAERAKLDQIIESLEQLHKNTAANEAKTLVGKRRGRKSMDSEARKEVSERMKRYWASRRMERNSQVQSDL